MANLVTDEDFAAWLGVDVAALNAARVTLLLDLVSGLIRTELDQVIELVVDDELELIGPGGEVLLVPELPVWEVTFVDETRHGVTTELVEDTDYRLELGHDGRRGIIRRLGRHWPDGELVTVTCSHGWDLDGDTYGDPAGTRALPSTLKLIALRTMARGYANPTGLRQETIGAYSYTDGAATPGLTLTASDLRDLAGFYPGTRSGGRK